jgi:FkbM family methyltransferase
MTLFHAIIYTPKVNWVLRNINYILSPFLPSKIKLHPSGTLKVRVDKNISFNMVTNQTSYLTRELFWKKPLNFEYSSLFVELIKRVSVFIDVGANIGYYSILGCKANDRLKVYAFEPSTGANNYMCENLKLNKLRDRVVVEHKALSDVNGEIDFYELKNLKFPDIYKLSGEHNIGTTKERLSVKSTVASVTLDTYVNSNNVQGVDLMKLDTEGAEAIILQGASKTIQRDKPIIICETLFNKIEGELERLMRSFDYSFYNHTGQGLQKVDSIIRNEDDGIRNCFFVPREKVSLIKEWTT